MDLKERFDITYQRKLEKRKNNPNRIGYFYGYLFWRPLYRMTKIIKLYNGFKGESKGID